MARKSLAKIKDSTNYYPHQEEGIRKVASKGSMLIADEMGLGKSLQALTVAAIDFERGRASRVLIVAPASLKWNWADEIERFTNFSHHVLDGTKTSREQQLVDFEHGKTDILIINYEQVEPHLVNINRCKFDVVIMDEAHYIKGYKSKRTQACMKIHGRRFLLLTGSPILGHVSDLWSLLWRIDPTAYPNYFAFMNRYAVYGGFKGKEITGTKNVDELHAKVDSIMLRRLKTDVLDLPDKQHITILVELHPEQKKMYIEARDELKIELPNDPEPLELENALTKMLYLKQICGTTAAFEGHADNSFKLDRVMLMVEEMLEMGEPVVLWTQFRAVQSCLAARLAAKGITAAQLHGDVPLRDRTEVIKRWSGGKPAPLIAMLQVGGVGLNMTHANRCIFLDKLYAPKLNEQAEDRIHRIGASTSQPVQIYHTLARGTIEDRIEQILNSKKKVFNKLIGSGDEPNLGWKRALYKALKEEDEI